MTNVRTFFAGAGTAILLIGAGIPTKCHDARHLLLLLLLFCKARGAAVFLQKMQPPARIQYRRVTSSFFCRLQHSKRSHMVQSLQPLRRLHELRVDQLPRGGGPPMG